MSTPCKRVRDVLQYQAFVCLKEEIMSQATLSIRMDEGLKRDFNSFCEDVGMTMSTAFVIFAKATVRERRIPFAIGEDRLESSSRQHALRAFATLRRASESGETPEMTLDEINAEIAAARAERHARERVRA